MLNIIYFFIPLETELQAILINFNLKENNEAHQTEELETKTLMLRRGQVFDVSVQFNRDYNPDTDVITLQFITGNQIQINNK